MITGTVIPAVGAATRIGGRKQLLEIHGVTLVDRACHTARAEGCTRVLGADAGEILQRPAHPGVVTFVHQNLGDGMGGLLAAGLCELIKLEPKCEAVFILLADQPLVSPEL